MDKKSLSVTKIKLSPDHKIISLELNSIQPLYVYQLNIGNVRSQSGDNLSNRVICYTVNKLKPIEALINKNNKHDLNTY